MKPHHTPGPWATHGLAVYTEAHVPHRITPHDPAPRYVGHAMWADMYGEDGLLDNMPAFLEAEANARLMAASPAMLAMLTELLDLWDAGIRPQIVAGLWREEQDFHDLIRRARKALDEIQK